MSLCPYLYLSLSHTPLSLLLQQVGEVITLADEVHVFAFLRVQLHHRPAVELLRQQQLLQHASVRLLLLQLQTLQLQTQHHQGSQTLPHTLAFSRFRL